MDYSLLHREVFSSGRLAELPAWEIFLSAYNKSERVNTVFAAVKADRKEWLIHPEYDFSETELPETGTVHVLQERDEAEFWDRYFSIAGVENWPRDARICIDSTG